MGHRPSVPTGRRAAGGVVRAYVGLGANVGDAAATLASAVHALGALPGARLRGVSRLYATAPVGVPDQAEFRNAVVALSLPRGRDAASGALGLLVELKRLERAFGRRVRVRWGPRELDLDLLVFGRARLRLERPPDGVSVDPVKAVSPGGRLLEVPHPEARERLFVLAPLADLAPGLVPPGWGETVERARRRRLAIEGDAAVRVVGSWDPAAGAWRPAGPEDDAAPGPGDAFVSGPRTAAGERPASRAGGRPAAGAGD